MEELFAPLLDDEEMAWWAEVREANAFVLPMLKLAASGKWPVLVDDDYAASGSKEHTAIYVNQFKAAWLRHPRIFSNFLSTYETDA